MGVGVWFPVGVTSNVLLALLVRDDPKLITPGERERERERERGCNY